MTSARRTTLGLATALAGFAFLVSSCADSAADSPPPDAPAELYSVVSVADGDTITVDIAGTRERIRFIGTDAPEVNGTTECFGTEAAHYAEDILTGTSVGLVPDPTQDDRDRYGRLLRYVILPDGTDFDAQLIAQGYAHEYTYDKPYQRQSAYRAAESAASSAGWGLWAPEICGAATAFSTSPASVAPPSSVELGPSAPSGAATADCDIKGNINSKGERIYHEPGDSSYPETVISASKGERYFCSVADAVAAGWRAAKN